MQELSMYLPGFIWPESEEFSMLFREQKFEALPQYLPKANISHQKTIEEASILDLCQIDSAQCALVLTQTQANQVSMQTHPYALMVTPGHLRVDRDRALLADTGILRLEVAEVNAFIESLNTLFAEDGIQFIALDDANWLLRAKTPILASFTPFAQVLGKDVNHFLPKGEQGMLWCRFLNEMQMLLFQHPVNDARELAQQIPLNSVWLWGGGNSDTKVLPSLVISIKSIDALYSDASVLRHIQAERLPVLESLPFDLASVLNAGHSHALLDVDICLAPNRYQDAWGYLEALRAFEQRYFMPAIAALKAKQIDKLNLIIPQANSIATLSFDRWSLKKFWQTATPLDQWMHKHTH